jgi:hypothetical protein
MFFFCGLCMLCCPVWVETLRRVRRSSKETDRVTKTDQDIRERGQGPRGAVQPVMLMMIMIN